MSSLKEIIKSTLGRLQKEGKSITPDEYRRAFCLEAKKVNFMFEDCFQADKYKHKLEKKYQENLKKYPMKEPDDFLHFLIGQLNQEAHSDHTQHNLLLKELIKGLLVSISRLHNLEAGEMAKTALNTPERLNDLSFLRIAKEQWEGFAKHYDPSFLDVWDTMIKVYKNDLETMNEQVYEYAKNKSDSGVVKLLEEMLENAALPSIAKKLDDRSRALIQAILNEIKAQNDINIADKIHELSHHRIEIDREEFMSRSGQVNELINVLSESIGSFVGDNVQFKDEIKVLKEELTSPEMDSENLAMTRKSLDRITKSMQEHVETLNKGLENKQTQIENLRSQMQQIEFELIETKKQAAMDHLTGLFTRRTLDEQLKRYEALFIRHGHNYAIAFFDIDFFKQVNDTYGHEAGDKILTSFGRLLSKNIRKEDVLARYGGEEFVALLPHTDAEGAYQFAENIRRLVEKSIFKYRESKMKITISAGIASRNAENSQEETMKNADDRLYKAKREGRNRVIV